MPRGFLKRHLPKADAIREQPLLRPVRHLLHEPSLWHLHRGSMANACFVGMFCAFMPIPGQTVVAVAMALALRCNLPIVLILIQITNPLTIAPMFFFAYRLGAWLLGTEATLAEFELSWGWLADNIALLWQPLLLGSVICGWVSGVTLMLAARLLWRLHVIRRWRERRERRRERRARDAVIRSRAAPAPGSPPRPSAPAAARRESRVRATGRR